MNIDIETYSSNDISKCGAYKYVEAEDFEILIIAYSIDGGPVSAIDMTKVDNEPFHADYETFKIALFDPEVRKYAFNANFERVCLAQHFNKEMPPEEWTCTMVNVTRIGLPASLDKVGEVLNLQNQKDKAGKNLIRYFSVPCKPTKVNGGRTRNLPQHDPKKWQQFIDYCVRDVEVEMSIATKIKDFPVTKEEQKYWSLDQHINDRGIKLSKSLMLGANELDKISKAELLKQATKITGLENPNSPSQLLKWLNEEQGLDIPNLQKKTVQEYLKYATGKAKQMLEIRLQMSKTSVKKYNKMHDMMCGDERVRGLFQFYGAGTGRWAGRGVQLQNLTKHYISDTELNIARDFIKEQRFDDLDLLLDIHPQDLLSQLVRTTFTA
ncbi:DNA polymerase, partial [Staphylococcus pseudintermedius]|nr:DNA polymerase [Staphylococcus pseudintermedius]